MRRVTALNVPQSGPAISPYEVAVIDIVSGIQARQIWGRLGWREIRRRYRRTVFGPFWTTLSLAIFATALGLVWSNIWKMDTKVYLPYLTSGLVAWTLFTTICTEGCAGIFGSDHLIKQLRISYTLLACATVWRNVIVFLHNLIVYALICVYAGTAFTGATLLVIPGLALLCCNALWLAVLLGAVCTRYRDVQQLVVNFLQIGMFVTPIFWTVDQLQGRSSELIAFNPLYHLVAIVRYPLLGEAPDALNWIVTGLMALGGWTLTVYVLGKFRHRIAYWL